MKSMNSTLYKAWLQYSSAEDAASREEYMSILGRIVVPAGEEENFAVALGELREGIYSMLGCHPEVVPTPGSGGCIQLGVAKEGSKLGAEDYTLSCEHTAAGTVLMLVGGSAVGVLYGAFHLLRIVASGQRLIGLTVTESPSCHLRMINHWDNADGSIERGYAGRSIFYREGRILESLDRVRDYARLLASVGINAISINNVNVHQVETRFITEDVLPDVARVANLFRSYGVKLFLSVNFAASIEVGGLDSADPLDPQVQAWWKEVASQIYRHIPDFGGFVVKADSEHRPGPFAYGRDHADGANMLAEALEPYGGLLIWRCFVYNCMQDWRDRKTDRAMAAYDHFKPLDGKFKDNVLLQIKNGPMDFQVREPVSPLFGAMGQTNQLMEFQIAQEYTGQQRHLCYLVPQWKEILEFDTYTYGEGSQVKSIVDGTLYGRKYSGIAAVSNIGDDENWTGHTLAQANLYGYGRLTWNPDLTAEEIAAEWATLTFGHEPEVVDTICRMLMSSWPIYESYTAPLGVGWMVTPNTHYGPDVDGYEYSRWGTYHYADRDGIGVDRTVATGTGYIAQYHSPNQERYERTLDCPDELLLFFHHVPYSHVLHSGKTVIQHIYDTHFEGVEEAEGLRRSWEHLKERIDPLRYESVAQRLAEQSEHARHWRDVINTYFYRKSGVLDAKGRTVY